MSLLSMLGRSVPRSLRNWIKSPRASIHWALDDMSHRLGQDVEREIHPGWTVRCHPAAFRVAYEILAHDPDQRAELDSFIGACTPGMRLFDIGAHFGVFSLAALHYGGAEAYAIAVDPSPMAVRMLATQASLNGLSQRLELVQAAVADVPGEAEFISVGVLAAGYFTAPEQHHGKRETTTVKTVTVDQLVEQHGSPPTHLKIDVEGFEIGVLQGAAKLLATRPGPAVFLELHNEMMRDRGLYPTEPLRLLEAAGYQVSSLSGLPISREHIFSQPLVRITARSRQV